MPSINRIRVNNVKYNFGTQAYDDFSMRLYGKNTLYDLANGGGKSILMLLLLQNVIPNCTLDDKQPIEKLFRTGGGNTTIHSLVEWKLDEDASKEGYRYMTTGFCARKAKDADGEAALENQTAAVEYFNYCIFYKSYNKNDIVNLPLSEGENRITYSGLKSYLKELAYKDMSLEVKVFERKGEYQRFISQYGLFESHWEIIRGINKTEGHVRTYFENNYKTTRKVVEDLLIEEIIEKAFLARTGRDAEDAQMAETLLDIKDKLNVLAKRKRDIAGYDHQIELINVLSSKVESCISRYEEHSAIAKSLADVYATGKSLAENEDNKLAEKLTIKNDALASLEAQKKRQECLKITRDNLRLAELASEIDKLTEAMVDNSRKVDALRSDIALKESMNDYQEYMRITRDIAENEAVLERAQSNAGADHEKMSILAYNRRLRDETNLTKLLADKEALELAKVEADSKYDYAKKCANEAEVAVALATERANQAERDMAKVDNHIAELSSGAELYLFGAPEEVLAEAEARQAKLEAGMAALAEKLTFAKAEQSEKALAKVAAEKDLESISLELATQSSLAAEYRASGAKLKNIMTVYGVEEPEDLADAINDRIEGTFAAQVREADTRAKLMAKKKSLEAGRIFEETAGVAKVIDYISTRHGKLAMHGADYISALPAEKRTELLEANPALPYGVVVKELAALADDPKLATLDTEGEFVVIYDMDGLTTEGYTTGANALAISKGAAYFTEDANLASLVEDVNRRLKDMTENAILTAEKLATYREDLAWVVAISDDAHIQAEEQERRLALAKENKKAELTALDTAMSKLAHDIASAEEAFAFAQAQAKSQAENKVKLLQISELTAQSKAYQETVEANKSAKAQAESDLARIRDEMTTWQTNATEEKAKLAVVAANIEEISNKWQKYFKPFYREGVELPLVTGTDEELELEFMAMHSISSGGRPEVEDKKRLIAALRESAERIVAAISKRGVTLADLQALPSVYATAEAELAHLYEECRRLELVEASLREEKSKVKGAVDRLSGNVEYAMASLAKSYGEDAYQEESVTMAQAEAALAKGGEVLASLEAAYKTAAADYDSAYREQGHMIELYKDVARIVNTNDIDVAEGVVLAENADKLRDIFEESLIKYDRSRKNIEKLKNELMRFKGQTAEALGEMKVYELAETIRRDVVIPETYAEARMLLESLIQITDFIKLEKERVEKGIEDMVAIKENFCSQCLQRSMDVKTELEKLPKLSKITVGDEVIKMVDLTVPYVKEEFLAQRMSDYIDDVVKGADTFEDERKRIKFIRDQLALKRLFSVMVTDMNAIRMKLYKRERIKEQSRYLRYEEAVGSTGQSQGIYIQFLVAVINYIAGMYARGNEEHAAAKTIFIDNPFGAAKDVYIWEPIFAMLAANNVQLVVPARGATPAITARFDVNYVLGQQMVGSRQQTVVVDYTSKTSQEELEYQELAYEQATFDFI